MSIPRGIPSVTYLRINGNQHQTGWIDVLADGPNSITIMETDQPISRHEVTQVLDRTLNDEEVCENIIGTLAGASLGVALNPISAFVLDAATSLILLIGSKQTRKWQFMKQIFLKFLANELYANQLADKEVQVTGFYDAQVSLTAFEINNEIITDLLQPQSRGFPVSFSAEEGVNVPGLHRQFVNNEMELRQYFEITTDNRSSFSLAPGASIDTSTGIWELELRQSENQMPGEVTRFTKSRLVVVDLAAIDPLVTLYAGKNNSGDGNNPWGGYRAPAVDITSQQVPYRNLSLVSPLVQSIAAFEEVLKRLSIPSQCPLAPFRASKLTYYLSELLGGNAVVAAVGFLSQGEAAISRKTLEVMESLTRTIHYPIGGREVSDAMQGLIRKYRAIAANATTELETRQGEVIDKAVFDALKQEYEEKFIEIEANFQEMDKELQTTLQSLQSTVTELETLRQKEKEQEETIVTLTEQLTAVQKESSQQVEEHEEERSQWTEKQIANDAIAEDNKVLLQKKEELVVQIQQLEEAKLDMEEENKHMGEIIAEFETAIDARNIHDEEHMKEVGREKQGLMDEVIRLQGLVTALEEDKQNLGRVASEKDDLVAKEQQWNEERQLLMEMTTALKEEKQQLVEENQRLLEAMPPGMEMNAAGGIAEGGATTTNDTTNAHAEKLDIAMQTIQKLEHELENERRRHDSTDVSGSNDKNIDKGSESIEGSSNEQPSELKEPLQKSTIIDEDIQAITRAKEQVEAQLQRASFKVQGQIDILKAKDDQLALKNSQLVKYQVILAEKQKELEETRAFSDRLQSELSKAQQRKGGLPSPPGTSSPGPFASRTLEPLHASPSKLSDPYASRTSFDDKEDLLSLRSRHAHSFRLQQMEVEDRATKLLQKNAELEQELTSYKEYMKKSVITLTKQKRDLEMQLRAYQNSMKGKNEPPGHRKGALPGIVDSPTPEDNGQPNFEDFNSDFDDDHRLRVKS